MKNNPYQLPVESLFLLAARINKKRSFLFVSKILGKHIPTRPAVPALAGAALAVRLLEVIYQQELDVTSQIVQGMVQPEKSEEVLLHLLEHPLELPEPLLFIGFAETATALGHSMFGTFGSHAAYIHTTREFINGMNAAFTFEEEHSHAVAHRFYPLDTKLLHSRCPIVLVDDEMTTGKTALNIIREMQHDFPRDHYMIASLLDWRSEEDQRKFSELEKELGIKITTISLMQGEFVISGSPGKHIRESREEIPVRSGWKPESIVLEIDALKKVQYGSLDSSGAENDWPYLLDTGRFGLTSEQHHDLILSLREAGATLRKIRQGTTLCMGTGEFMYLPMLLAAFMGDDVWYQSTTRSPIHPSKKEGYAVKNAFSYTSPDDPTVHNFIYNIPEHRYDELFLFMERGTSDERLQSLYTVLSKLPIPHIYVVTFR